MSRLTENTDMGVGDSGTLPRRRDPRSPLSAGQSGTLNASTVSMRAKAQRKRKANMQHNTNFSAGYVEVDEDVLHKSGIRGRKRYFLYCMLVTLLMVAILNAAVTAWLVYLLGMSHYGMTSLEITSMEGRDFLRVLSDAHIITLTFTGDGALGGRRGHDLRLAAPHLQVQVASSNSTVGASIMQLEGGNVTLTTDNFKVNNMTLDLISLTDSGHATSLYVDSVTTGQIEALEANGIEDVYMESINQVEVEGSKVEVTSGDVLEVTADEVRVMAEKAIVLKGHHGVYIDASITTINVTTKRNNNNRNNNVNTTTITDWFIVPTVKLCVCGSGLLYATDADSCEHGHKTRTC